MFFKNNNFSDKDKQLLWICLTLVICCFLISGAISKIKENAKYVSVRGLSEKTVSADQALWPIKASATGNSLAEVYAQIDSTQKNIIDFLKRKGFTDDEININQPLVTDRQAQLYVDNNNLAAQRYIAEIGILLKTNKIETVRKASQEISELVGKGISLNQANVEYVYTKLNDIKPVMIEEATKEARKAAEKFAKNSGTWLGPIKYAYQGLFTIEDEHYYTQYLKKIRVVTDVEYYLN